MQKTVELFAFYPLITLSILLLLELYQFAHYKWIRKLDLILSRLKSRPPNVRTYQGRDPLFDQNGCLKTKCAQPMALFVVQKRQIVT